jgi:Protein of unknown function (DUF2628)
VSAVTVYSVYEPSGEDSDVVARADKLAFVKEGFSWPAFFVPALWLIFHRMWIELAIVIVAFLALQWAFGFDEQGQRVFGWVSFALFTLFAFEANDLRSAALERRGYQLAGVAMGKDQTEAELSFFRGWLPQEQRAARQVERAPERAKDADKPVPSGGDSEEVIGLFPRS